MFIFDQGIRHGNQDSIQINMKEIFKLNLIIILLICTLSCASSQKLELTGTKWTFEYSGCADYFLFKENYKYEFFSCELQEFLYGKYQYNSDSIFLEEIRSEFDNEFDESSRHRLNPKKIILLKDENKLRFIKRMQRDINGNWTELKGNLESYIFTKEE